MLFGAPLLPATGSLFLLAPTSKTVPETLFRSVQVDRGQHAHLLAAVQRLRGSVYLDDGAITRAQLSSDGRHIQDADRHSWHVVAVQPDGTVTGCARYRPHPRGVRPEDLGIWESALARDPRWRSTLRKAIADQIDQAAQASLSYVEVGGWAVASGHRGTLHAFETAVSAYALASGLGGCMGITTATVRHCSSRILRKLGGASLSARGVTLPSYYDPRYGCEMEILRFDSRTLNRRFGAHVDRVFMRFQSARVIAGDAVAGAAAARPAVGAVASFAERYFPAFVPQDGLAAAV
jgi:hypothetical protein